MTTLREAVLEMLSRMDLIGHKTAWMRADPGVFVLVTQHPETAARIHAVLEREGLLCQTDMGEVGKPWEPPTV